MTIFNDKISDLTTAVDNMAMREGLVALPSSSSSEDLSMKSLWASAVSRT